MPKFTKKQAKKIWDKVFDTIECPKCGTRIRNASAKARESWRISSRPEFRGIRCKHCHYKIELEVSESGEILNYS